MLSGEAVVAIWNDITAEGRSAFYDWHLHEHMPERTGIPGFTRGRRYVAAEPATQPEFFTLYEAMTFGVLQGSDYLARLNAPTPWTRTATAGFRNTARALARVLGSFGRGGGGVALTVRFAAEHATAAALLDLVRTVANASRVTGAHLCAGDPEASSSGTAESQGRSDLQAPPAWFAMVEATDAAALAPLLTDAALHEVGARRMVRGCYRLEYTRGKTAFSAA